MEGSTIELIADYTANKELYEDILPEYNRLFDTYEALRKDNKKYCKKIKIKPYCKRKELFSPYREKYFDSYQIRYDLLKRKMEELLDKYEELKRDNSILEEENMILLDYLYSNTIDNKKLLFEIEKIRKRKQIPLLRPKFGY